MADRLTIHDSSLFPVQAFFNAVSDDSFISVMDSLTNGVGYSTNECDCSFPGDLDPGDEVFQGVRFSLFEQSAVITQQELAAYIRKVCVEFVVRYSDEQDKVARIVSRL